MIDLATKPTLEGSLARLRPFRDDDLDALWEMLNDAEGNRLTGTHERFTRDAVERWYATRGEQTDRLDLAIADIRDDALVGEVALHELDAHNLSCGFRISLVGPHVYGQGYGRDATRSILAHGFDHVGLNRIELEVFDFNARARALYEAVGFTVEGVRRQALRWEGAWHDAVLMSILADEWRGGCGKASSASN